MADPWAKLPWNDCRRRWRVRWWQVLLAVVILALLDALYVRHLINSSHQELPPSAPDNPQTPN
jgi:uncharacterized membrane protein YdfJ with MMPL/SSD domain